MAGLASAVAHKEAGARVTLIEARRTLGGRAWAREQDDLDNGPHVLLGCYKAMRRLLRCFRSESGFYHAPVLELSWMEKGGRLMRLRPNPRLPAPLHLLQGMLAFDGLPLERRFDLLGAGIAPFLPLPREREDLLSWLRRQGQSEDAITIFFEPLCRAVMNEEMRGSEAKLFLQTLREAFLGSKEHSAMWIPKRSWDSLLSAPALRWCTENDITLHLGTRVIELDRVTAHAAPDVILTDGSRLSGFDRVVVAVPWKEAARLLPDEPQVAKAAAIKPSPIVTVHAELPEALPFEDPVVALVGGTPFHFICRRSDNDGHARSSTQIAILAGAADELEGRRSEDCIQIALNQVASYLGRKEPWPDQCYASARVIREPIATIRPNPGLSALRPKPGPTCLPGIWVAGDWCDTGLPSTLEGAARSGFEVDLALSPPEEAIQSSRNSSSSKPSFPR